MKLLITRSQIPHFYRVDREVIEELVPLNFADHEIGQPTLNIKFDLPWEIATIIIHHLFDLHMKDYNFDLAAALTRINKPFSYEIYNKTFGRSNIAPATRVKRMCSALYILEQIHDNYLTQKRLNTYPACRLIKPGIATEFVPWSFILDCFPIALHGVVVDEGETVQQYVVGPLNGDLVWLSGRYNKDGIYNCSRFKHPIINLEICNYADNNQITSDFLMSSRPFKKFTQLIKKAYGPNTGIHVSFDDSIDNPFDLSGQGFIEF